MACNPCVTGFPTEYNTLLNCNNTKNTRKSGIDQMAFIKCDQTIDVLTDEAEWTALKATAGNLVRTPSGFGSYSKPNQKKEKLTGCAPEVVTDETLSLNFSTKLFDNDTFTDFDFLCDLKGSYSNYTLVWIGCDGLLYYSSEWATGENPRFDNLSLAVWEENPEDALKEMKFEVEFKLNARCLKGVKKTDSLKKIIFG